MSMNHENLFGAIEATYGKYPGILGTFVKDWLKSQNQADFPSLMGVIVNRHPLQFKTPPDMEQLKAYLEEAKEARAHEEEKARTAKLLTDHRLLLEAPEEVVHLDGRNMSPGEALMHLVTKAYQRGVNPHSDPDILAFKRRYVKE